MREYDVYMLRCADGSFYVGVTNDLTARVSQHQIGIDPGCYTYKRRPVELVFNESFKYVLDAIKREKQIKGWSRKKKEALCRYDYDALPELSVSGYGKRIWRMQGETHAQVSSHSII